MTNETEDREPIGFVVVCDNYRSGRFTTRAAAERVLARVEKEGLCALGHRVEEVYRS